MLGRIAAVVLVFSWLPDCKGEGEPGGSVKKFVLTSAAKGWSAEMCTDANAGKRYWLEGYLQLSSSMSIRGPTSLFTVERTATAGAWAIRSRSP